MEVINAPQVCACCRQSPSPHNPSAVYTYTYGTHMGKRTEDELNLIVYQRWTTTESWAVGGERKVTICRECVRGARRSAILRVCLGYALCLAPSATTAILYRFSPTLGGQSLHFVVPLQIILLYIGWVYRRKAWNAIFDSGSRAAIGASSDDLRLEGCDTFWTPLEIDDLRSGKVKGGTLGGFIGFILALLGIGLFVLLLLE